MVIYKCYLRFCASVNFFFERVRNDDDPGIPALLFVTVLFSVYSYGFFIVLNYLLAKKSMSISLFSLEYSYCGDC